MPADRNALLEISAAINSTRDLETLEKHLLEIISRTLYADRGAIMLLGERGEQFASVCGWDSGGALNRPAGYSRAIIDRVLREKAPLLSNRDSAAMNFQKLRGRGPDHGGVVRTAGGLPADPRSALSRQHGPAGAF